MITDTTDTLTHHTINGAPLAFSNLGTGPLIDSNDFFAPDLTINADIVLNANLSLRTTVATSTFSTIFLNGTISGAGGLEHIGGGDVRMGGTAANTYAGVTKMTAGYLYLSKPASVIAIPGDLFMNGPGGTRGRGGRVYILSDNQIASTSTVTINRGTLFVEGGDQTLAKIEFVGRNDPFLNIDGGNVMISPSRTLTIAGGVTRIGVSDPFFTPSTSLISGGTLDLGGGLRSFHVDNLTPQGFTPTTLTVNSVIANGGIEKTGVGVLHLSQAKNTFTGNVLVSGGLFSVGQNGELRFDLANGGASNRILGTADAFLNGVFRIDPAAVTDISSSWNLVDVANLNETFGTEFKLQFVGGTSFTNIGAGVYRSGRWKFTTADGNLTLSAVPEPAGFALVACGGLVLGLHSRLRRRLTDFAVAA